VRTDEGSEECQLDCARQIVRILIENSGLATIIPTAPAVIVGRGNWISFKADRPVSIEMVLGMCQPGGNPAFVPDMLTRRRARSSTSPSLPFTSLHFTNLASGEDLIGHVDAHYSARNPIGHANEYLKKKTTPPSDLLKRILSRP
jgi:hypothetical protein